MCTFVTQLPTCLIILFICEFAHHVGILLRLHEIVYKTDTISQELEHLYKGRVYIFEDRKDGKKDLLAWLILEIVQLLKRTKYDMVRGTLRNSFLRFKSLTREKCEIRILNMALSAQCGLHHQH